MSDSYTVVFDSEEMQYGKYNDSAAAVGYDGSVYKEGDTSTSPSVDQEL